MRPQQGDVPPETQLAMRRAHSERRTGCARVAMVATSRCAIGAEFAPKNWSFISQGGGAPTRGSAGGAASTSRGRRPRVGAGSAWRPYFLTVVIEVVARVERQPQGKQELDDGILIATG